MGKSLSDRFNAGPPKPGSLKAISQHKAIGQGYEAAPCPSPIKVNLHGTTTKGVHTPGMGSKR
jgi:hypothetical protein